MNNFTKEELDDLVSWLTEIHHDSFDDVGCTKKQSWGCGEMII